MRTINRVILQDVLNELAPRLSIHPLNGLRFALGDIFELALGDGVVDRNPCSRLFTPPNCKPSKKKEALTSIADLEPIKALLDVQELPVFLLTCSAGMSIGEVLGLRLRDLRLADVALDVEWGVYRGKITRPKTRNRLREVGLNEEIVGALRSWIELLDDRSPDAWLFPSKRTQRPMDRDGILKRIKSKLRPIGMDWVTFQVGRRSWATIAKGLEIDPHVRAGQLGHTVDVTENVYALATHEAKTEAMKKFSKASVPV